jgi:hypothetical protein
MGKEATKHKLFKLTIAFGGAIAFKKQTPRHHCVRLPNLNSPPFNLAGVADVFCHVVAQIQ